MENISDRTERLIVRKLDGEITPEEELELDRELLRSPAVRELYESYKAIDGLAADVLEACAVRSSKLEPAQLVPVRATPAAGGSRSWMIYASALAACLAFVIFWRTPGREIALEPHSGTSLAQSTAPSTAPATNRIVPRIGHPGGDGGVWNVVDMPAQLLQRRTDRNVLVVPGEDGNFFFFNVDRVREVSQPTEQNNVPWGRDPI